jgi:hypothetical protein
MRLIVTTLTLLTVLVLASCGGESQSRQRQATPSAHASAHGQEAQDQPIVASKWSRKFHEAGCEWARKIKPGNLVGYESKEDAGRDGRQPCGACHP